jgi:hypothetical protein
LKLLNQRKIDISRPSVSEMKFSPAGESKLLKTKIQQKRIVNNNDLT